MTESIKFGPEWLRNSVANVSTSSTCTLNSTSSVSTDAIISRPVLSDHRYGREEMLSLCDKSNRVPEVLTKFRRLYVNDWQTPLALTPNADDERPMGSFPSSNWNSSHMRSIIPGGGVGRGISSSGIMRGGSVERGRGRGRGVYHGFNRSTSSYDDESRRTNAWIDRNGNGVDNTSEWGNNGNLASPRRDFSRGLENWRRGIKDEEPSNVDWRSSSNTAAGGGNNTSRDKFMSRSISWREGDPESNNQNQAEMMAMANDKNTNSPNNATMPHNAAMIKKSWDEDHLPEWATESFDYGGTFDSSGAFMGSNVGEVKAKMEELKLEHRQQQQQQHQQRKKLENDQLKKIDESLSNKKNVENIEPPQQQQQQQQVINMQQKQQQDDELAELQKNIIYQQHNMNVNMQPGMEKEENHIDMKTVADFVANLIKDDPKEPDPIKPTPNHVQNNFPTEWFYLDPQGDTQGPFSPQDMSEWYKAGYFQENLMVKRAIDPSFVPLGHVLKVCGRATPFFTNFDAMISPSPPQPIFPNMMFPQSQQPMMPPNDWTMLTPEQQILFLNMRQQQQNQRPPSTETPTFMKPPPVGPSNPLDVRPAPHMVANEFMHPNKNVEMDPIQQLLMQLKPKYPVGGDATGAPPHWMAQQQQQQMSTGEDGTSNWQSQPPPSQKPWNNVDQMPTVEKMEQQQQQQLQPQQMNMNRMLPMDGNNLDSSIQNHHHHHAMVEMETKIVENKKKRQKEVEQQHQQMLMQQQMKKEQQQQAEKVAAIKKKEKQIQQQQQQQQQQIPPQQQNAPQQQQQQQIIMQKEERSNQPSVPAPWVGHQTTQSASNTSLAKIQKSEAQRRQNEMAAQREREMLLQQQMQIQMQQHMGQKNETQKWATPQNHVKSLDEIQAEEKMREAAIKSKQKELVKKSEVANNDAGIWNSSSYSIAWQQPKSWTIEQNQAMSSAQTSSKGFWEEPTKPANNNVKSVQMLTKSQTMATINSNKKQMPATPPNVAVVKKPTEKPKKNVETADKRDIKDDNNNEFTNWCTHALNSFNGNIDVPTFVTFLQDIESPFEVKDYIKMYLGETKECAEFAKQFLERRSKQRNQQRLKNAHIDDLLSPAPALTPTNDFQEVKSKTKKVKSKKSMKAADSKILGFTSVNASDRINVGDRDYGDS